MNYIETCTKIAVFLWRSSNYRPLKSVLHVRPEWIIYQNMRETWEKKVMKFEREIPIGLDARRKKWQRGWKSPPPPPPMGLGLKPQDSFGEFFLIFKKCKNSSENIIRPSCKMFWMTYCNANWNCPMANYHYVYNLWPNVRGDSENVYVLVISWKWKHFKANC